MRFWDFLLAALLFVAHTSNAQNAVEPAPQPTPLHRVQAGVTALQRWYVPQTGLYSGTGWWNAANAITTLADALRVSGSRDNEAMVANTFAHAQVTVPKAQQVGALDKMTGFPGFQNDYYDDEGWWALAWVNAYDLTGKPEYLTMAASIFRDMSGGWDETCGGGIWWSKQHTYKNAIANELFFSVAAHLSRRLSGDDKKQAAAWAAREWQWFQGTGMINRDHLVNDGLTIDKADGTCRNNGRTVWTYNQGVVLGGLAEWYRVTHDDGLLVQARVLADAGLAHLTDENGILHDPCEPNHCGADANQFKGIFVRNLYKLNGEVQEPRYRAFFAANAASIWQADRTGTDQFGVVWSGSVAQVNAGTHSSALDALVAAAGDR